MPLLRRKRLIAVKIETTPGTAESLADADAAFNAYETVINADIEFQEREGQGAFSPLPGTLGGYGGTCTFQTDIIGGASVPFWASRLLPACGFVDTAGVFTPRTEAPGANVKTVTIGVYENGLLKVLRGCMGTAVMTFPAGRRAFVEFTMTGLWAAPQDAAMLTPTYPTIAPLRFAGADFSIGAWEPCIEQATVDFGNDVTLRECPTDASGYATAIVTGRRIVGTINPEASLVDTNDVYGQWRNRTEREMEILIGGSGNRVTVTAPKMQITNAQEGERNNVQIDEVEYQCNRNAAAGDDELSIDFT